MNKRDKGISLSINTTILVLYIVIFFLTGSLFSQDPEPQTMEITGTSGLEDLLAYAALRNPGLEAAFNRWKAALQVAPQVRSMPDPRFTFAYFIREIETRVGPQRQKLGLAQTFPWFGKLKLAGHAAMEAAESKKQAYEKKKLELFFRVKDAYYEYYYITRAAALLGENVVLLEYLERVVETNYRTGRARHSDLIKVQVELEKLKEWRSSTEESAEPLKARLNLVLNRPKDALLPIPGEIPEIAPSLPNGERIEQLLKNNPGLKALDHQVARGELAVKLARKQYYPDVTLGLDYMVTGEARMAGVADSGKDPFSAMVSFHLPLGIGKRKAALAEARAGQRVAIKEREEARNRLLADYEMKVYQFRDSDRKVTLYRDNIIPRARQALAVTQSSFQAGGATFLDLIDSQRTLLGLELAFERSLATRQQRLAELEMLVNSDLTRRKASESNK